MLLCVAPAAHAQFTYTTNNGTITITGYTGTNDDVVIPGAIDDLPVISIWFSAFYGSGITFVTIPNSVTSIWDNAFRYCTSLTNVTIPNSVTNIGRTTFLGCTSLTSVTLGSSLASIGMEAFAGCTNLTGVTIPNSVTSIDDAVFAGCSSLTSVTIPNSVTYIPAGAFGSCSNLTGITIPNSVTSIWQGAFSYCTRLTNVTIPNSVTNIGDSTFQGCTSLTSIPLGSNVTSIGNDTFAGCTSLTNLTIPTSVTNIGIGAFGGCTNLTSVAIPNSVTSIREAAFSYCSSLTNIMVDPLNSAFSSVDGVLFNQSQTTLVEYPGGKLGGYMIPNSVTSIGDDAFEGSGVTSITMPNTVTSIGLYAFSGTRLTNVTIPKSVTSIGAIAFSGASLTNIMVDPLNSAFSSVDGVLFNQSQTTLVEYPGGKLGGYMIPNSVTSIADDAFSGTRLTNVTIPNSVTSIGNGAFSECLGLTSIYFQGNAPSVVGGYLFENDNATVYYLPGTTGWGPRFDVLLTTLWRLPYPLILTGALDFGVRTNQFGFTVSWATHLNVVVETASDLANPIWSPVQTNTLSSGSSYFSDPQWTNYPNRFYRIRSP